jgi:hypothetical protein
MGNGMLLTLALCLGGHAFAGFLPDLLDPAQWSTIVNDSGKEQLLQITDEATTIGNVFIKKHRASGNGTKLSKPGESFTLAKKTTYSVYFDTNLGNLAMTIGIGTGKNRLQLNFKRGIPTGGTGDRLVVSPANYLTESNVILALSGFRNTSGPAFITIKESAPTKRKKNDDDDDW